MIVYISYFTRVISIFLILFSFEYSAAKDLNEESIQGVFLSREQAEFLIKLTQAEVVKKQSLKKKISKKEVNYIDRFAYRLLTQKEIDFLIEQNIDRFNEYNRDSKNRRWYSLDEINLLTQKKRLQIISSQFIYHMKQGLKSVLTIKAELDKLANDNAPLKKVSADPRYKETVKYFKEDVSKVNKIYEESLDIFLVLFKRIKHKNPDLAEKIRKEEFLFFYTKYQDITNAIQVNKDYNLGVDEVFFNFIQEQALTLHFFLYNFAKDQFLATVLADKVERIYDKTREALLGGFVRMDEIEECRRIFTKK